MHSNMESIFFFNYNCASQKKENDTPSAVAIATISAPVSFCQKIKYPYFQPLPIEGPTWNRHSSHIVVTSVRNL